MLVRQVSQSQTNGCGARRVDKLSGLGMPSSCPAEDILGIIIENACINSNQRSRADTPNRGWEKPFFIILCAQTCPRELIL